jgi:PAS domain-containing protein
VRHIQDDHDTREVMVGSSAVVEEAQRMLSERLGCSSPEALGHLERVAGEKGVGVTTVAATLVGDVRLDATAASDPAVIERSRLNPAEWSLTWIDPVLDVIPTPAALLIPIRDAAGAIVEFRIDRCNDEATDLLGRTPEQITGRDLREAFPGVLLSGIFEAYVRVMETGEPVRLGPLTYQEPINGVLCPAVLSARAQKVGDRLLVSWRFHDEEARLEARMRDVERMVSLGWAEWNAVTGETSWTRPIYEMLGHDPARPPLPLAEIPDRVEPEDAPEVRRAITALTELHRPETFEFRVGERHVAATTEPVLDNFGQPIAFRGVMQDVTARRRIEEQLAQSRLELERQRLRLAEEMQRALLPETDPTLPALRVAVRYHPAQNTAQVGGDWFEATTLPDGRVLIAIGDASGHGLSAAARMAQLRSALIGVAFTGADAAGILHCLNRVVHHTQDQTATATAVVAHFDPATRVLSWARAGHPAPVLVRDGRARRLRNAYGTLLGAAEDMEYRVTRTRLRPGDLVFLYTDGLVERRTGDLADPAQVLQRAARAGGAADPDSALDAFDFGNPEDDTCALAFQVTHD